TPAMPPQRTAGRFASSDRALRTGDRSPSALDRARRRSVDVQGAERYPRGDRRPEVLMPVDVVMPKLSDTMEEGKILRWLKKPGDHVTVGEVLAEVETDKADMELEAEADGVLSKILIEEAGSASVGQAIALLGDGSEKRAAPKPADVESGPGHLKPDDRRSTAIRPPERERRGPRAIVPTRPE